MTNSQTIMVSAVPAQLGLKAAALAWPEVALAFSNARPGQSQQTWPGLGHSFYFWCLGPALMGSRAKASDLAWPGPILFWEMGLQVWSRPTVDRTGICLGIDMTISAYYFGILSYYAPILKSTTCYNFKKLNTSSQQLFGCLISHWDQRVLMVIHH